MGSKRKKIPIIAHVELLRPCSTVAEGLRLMDEAEVEAAPVGRGHSRRVEVTIDPPLEVRKGDIVHLTLYNLHEVCPLVPPHESRGWRYLPADADGPVVSLGVSNQAVYEREWCRIEDERTDLQTRRRKGQGRPAGIVPPSATRPSEECSSCGLAFRYFPEHLDTEMCRDEAVKQLAHKNEAMRRLQWKIRREQDEQDRVTSKPAGPPPRSAGPPPRREAQRRTRRLELPDVRCHCGAEAVLTPNEEVYGRSFGNGWSWVCSKFPWCDSYTGSLGDFRPAGKLADRQTRKLRSEIHERIDIYWKMFDYNRGEIYARMAELMGTRSFHVGDLDYEGCLTALAILDAYEEENPWARLSQIEQGGGLMR